MYHDIFHGMSHVCSPSFKAQRLQGMMGINISICEQFNNFLQCIKASSKHMTQIHFMFNVQFFVRQWNLKKKKKYLPQECKQ